jgi:HSP20 family molecular chaperone IbpA
MARLGTKAERWIKEGQRPCPGETAPTGDASTVAPGYPEHVEKRRDIEHAAEEIEQLFADLWQVFPFSRGLRRHYRPQVDVYRSEDPPTLTVQIELPGVEPGDVQLIASPQALLIAGERRRPKDSGHYQQMEIDHGPFQRQITLAENTDPEEAVATYERGILTVRLPIAPRPAPSESVTIVVRTS